MRHHARARELKEINWLPKKEGVKQHDATKVFKYWKNSPFYVNEPFVPSRNICKTRSHMALEILLRKSNLGQRAFHFRGHLYGIN